MSSKISLTNSPGVDEIPCLRSVASKAWINLGSCVAVLKPTLYGNLGEEVIYGLSSHSYAVLRY